MITTRQLWSALPYSARRVLVPEDIYTDWPALDPAVWTLGRIERTPWYILPPEAKEAIHGMVACTEMEGEG